MKAVIWTAYGPPEVLQLREIEKPVPGDNEVLVKIHATTVTAGELQMRRMDVPLMPRLLFRIYLGIGKPTRVTILGQELAGEIESVGKGVTRFSPGDRVVAATGLRLGAYAEYKTLPERSMIARFPPEAPFEEAATVPVAGQYAHYFVSQAGIRPGQSVLINGAAGSIGSYAVQLAKRAGAEVTGVDSADKLDFLLALGADHAIDYTSEDFTRNVGAYDVIMDPIDKASFSRVRPALRPGGLFLHSNLSALRPWRGARRSGADGKRAEFVADKSDPADLVSLTGLLAAGELKAIIDRRYPLEQAAEAHRYAETDRKKGHIVLTVG